MSNTQYFVIYKIIFACSHKIFECRNANPERREAYIQKERDRWRRVTDKGKKKGINDLTERGKRSERKKLKEAKKAARAKAHTVVELETPPSTPESPPQQGPDDVEG